MEGIDKTAHYSYIQQLAEIGTWPRFGEPESAEVEDYLKIALVCWKVASLNSTQPPSHCTGSRTQGQIASDGLVSIGAHTFIVSI